MRIAALLLMMTVGLVEAAACPPGPCNKYRQVPVEAEPVVYRRAVRGAPPVRFDLRAIVRFLSASTWLPELTPIVANTPFGHMTPARNVRFVAASNVRPSSDRLVIVRQIERRNGTTYVEIDGVFFELARCLGGRRAFGCLNRVGSLPDEKTTKQFATPP